MWPLCGGVELTLYREWQYVEEDCAAGSGGDSSSDGGRGGSAAGSGSGNSPNPFDEAPIDPPYIHPVEGCSLARGDGNAKNDLNQRLNDTLCAVGLSNWFVSKKNSILFSVIDWFLISNDSLYFENK